MIQRGVLFFLLMFYPFLMQAQSQKETSSDSSDVLSIKLEWLVTDTIKYQITVNEIPVDTIIGDTLTCRDTMLEYYDERFFIYKNLSFFIFPLENGKIRTEIPRPGCAKTAKGFDRLAFYRDFQPGIRPSNLGYTMINNNLFYELVVAPINNPKSSIDTLIITLDNFSSSVPMSGFMSISPREHHLKRERTDTINNERIYHYRGSIIMMRFGRLSYAINNEYITDTAETDLYSQYEIYLDFSADQKRVKQVRCIIDLESQDLCLKKKWEVIIREET